MAAAPLVEVLVLKGAMASSVALTLDLLATANQVRASSGRTPAFRVRISGSGARAARAMMSAAARGAAPTGRAAIIVVPGLGLTTEAAVTSRLARRDAVAAQRILAEAVANGAEVCTSCSGTFLFARSGVLGGRRATTTWWLAPLFRRLHPDVRLDTDALVVTDGRVTTAGAAVPRDDRKHQIDLRHGGARLADQCARYLLLDQRRSQARYMALGFLAAADERVARAEAWARARLGEDFKIDDLAAAVGLSPRTFARRIERTTGLSPVRFLQRLRVERAIELLETSRLSLDQIAREVGYAEPSTLRRLIRQTGGERPRALRPVAALKSGSPGQARR